MLRTFKLAQGYITQKVGSKISIFRGEDSTLITFNETAAVIFQGLKLGWDDEKIVAQILKEFDTSTKLAKADVITFKQLLVDKHILEPIS